MSRFFMLFLFVLVSVLSAQDSTKTVTAFYLESPPQIDGYLNETFWDQSKSISGLIQRNPDEGQPATQKTHIWVAYDEANIYVAARMEDTRADSIIARLGRRDSRAKADRFGVYFDPYHDKRSGYYFGLNAAGVYYDGAINNDSWFDEDWDAVWEGKVQIDDRGWSAEFKIPLTQMRFPDREEQVWGINFSRDITRNLEEDYFIFWPKDESAFVSRFATLRGLKNLKLGSRLEILPYARLKNERIAPQKGDPFNDGSRYRPGFGLDLKYGLTSNLTLNASFNPDFGQVEVDPAVVNLSDFETFYSEKRPFFIEGSSNYRFGSGGATNNWNFNWSNPNFFYSRRIGRQPQGSARYSAQYADVPEGSRILGAAKITGKVMDNLNVGFLSAVTAREEARLGNSDGSRFSREVEPLTSYNILRLQKEFNEGRQGIGFIGTHLGRNFKETYLKDEMNASSLAAGIDGWTFLDKEKVWVVSGWTGYSRLQASARQMTRIQTNSVHRFQRPDFKYASLDTTATALSGLAGRISLSKERGNWMFNSAFGFIQPGFDVNDLGFQFRANVINMHMSGGYRWTQPTSYFRTLSILGSVFGSTDFDGNFTGGGIWSNINWQALNYFNIGIGLIYSPQSKTIDRTRGGPITIARESLGSFGYFSSDRSKTFSFNGGYNFFTNSAGSKNYGLNAGLSWRPADNIYLSVRPRYSWNLPDVQWVGAFGDKEARATFGNRYIFAQMSQKTLSAGIRLNWTFTPELSLQLYAQPLTSSGHYKNFKYLNRPNSYDFRKFKDDGTLVKEGSFYTADPDGPGGPAEPVTFYDPDFSFTSIRGNAVLRWEYTPGSRFYLVWTQNMSDFSQNSTFDPGQSFSTLIADRPADNIFLVKVTYWLGV